MGSIPGQGAGIPHASWPKKQNRNSVVTNLTKTFKMSTPNFFFFSIKGLPNVHLLIGTLFQEEWYLSQPQTLSRRAGVN